MSLILEVAITLPFRSMPQRRNRGERLVFSHLDILRAPCRPKCRVSTLTSPPRLIYEGLDGREGPLFASRRSRPGSPTSLRNDFHQPSEIRRNRPTVKKLATSTRARWSILSGGKSWSRISFMTRLCLKRIHQSSVSTKSFKRLVQEEWARSFERSIVRCNGTWR